MRYQLRTLIVVHTALSVGVMLLFSLMLFGLPQYHAQAQYGYSQSGYYSGAESAGTGSSYGVSSYTQSGYSKYGQSSYYSQGSYANADPVGSGPGSFGNLQNLNNSGNSSNNGNNNNGGNNNGGSQYGYAQSAPVNTCTGLCALAQSVGQAVSSGAKAVADTAGKIVAFINPPAVPSPYTTLPTAVQPNTNSSYGYAQSPSVPAQSTYASSQVPSQVASQVGQGATGGAQSVPAVYTQQQQQILADAQKSFGCDPQNSACANSILLATQGMTPAEAHTALQKVVDQTGGDLTNASINLAFGKNCGDKDCQAAQELRDLAAQGQPSAYSYAQGSTLSTSAGFQVALTAQMKAVDDKKKAAEVAGNANLANNDGLGGIPLTLPGQTSNGSSQEVKVASIDPNYVPESMKSPAVPVPTAQPATIPANGSSFIDSVVTQSQQVAVQQAQSAVDKAKADLAQAKQDEAQAMVDRAGANCGIFSGVCSVTSGLTGGDSKVTDAAALVAQKQAAYDAAQAALTERQSVAATISTNLGPHAQADDIGSPVSFTELDNFSKGYSDQFGTLTNAQLQLAAQGKDIPVSSGNTGANIEKVSQSDAQTELAKRAEIDVANRSSTYLHTVANGSVTDPLISATVANTELKDRTATQKDADLAPDAAVLSTLPSNLNETEKGTLSSVITFIESDQKKSDGTVLRNGEGCDTNCRGVILAMTQTLEASGEADPEAKVLEAFKKLDLNVQMATQVNNTTYNKFSAERGYNLDFNTILTKYAADASGNPDGTLSGEVADEDFAFSKGVIDDVFSQFGHPQDGGATLRIADATKQITLPQQQSAVKVAEQAAPENPTVVAQTSAENSNSWTSWIDQGIFKGAALVEKVKDAVLPSSVDISPVTERSNSELETIAYGSGSLNQPAGGITVEEAKQELIRRSNEEEKAAADYAAQQVQAACPKCTVSVSAPQTAPVPASWAPSPYQTYQVTRTEVVSTPATPLSKEHQAAIDTATAYLQSISSKEPLTDTGKAVIISMADKAIADGKDPKTVIENSLKEMGKAVRASQMAGAKGNTTGEAQITLSGIFDHLADGKTEPKDSAYDSIENTLIGILNDNKKTSGVETSQSIGKEIGASEELLAATKPKTTTQTVTLSTPEDISKYSGIPADQIKSGQDSVKQELFANLGTTQTPSAATQPDKTQSSNPFAYLFQQHVQGTDDNGTSPTLLDDVKDWPKEKFDSVLVKFNPNLDAAETAVADAATALETAKENAQHSAIDSQAMFAYSNAILRFNEAQKSLDDAHAAVTANDLDALNKAALEAKKDADASTLVSKLAPTLDRGSESGIKYVTTATPVYNSPVPNEPLVDHAGPNDTFGSGRPGGRLHAGIDIYGNKGDPVVAVMDGIVVRSDDSDPTGYGNRIDILYPDGTVHRMAHLDTRDVKKGDPVTAGEVVGTMGRSGIEDPNTGTHTHYEVIKADAYKQGLAVAAYSETALEEGRIDPMAYFNTNQVTTASAETPTKATTKTELTVDFDAYVKQNTPQAPEKIPTYTDNLYNLVIGLKDKVFPASPTEVSVADSNNPKGLIPPANIPNGGTTAAPASSPSLADTIGNCLSNIGDCAKKIFTGGGNAPETPETSGGGSHNQYSQSAYVSVPASSPSATDLTTTATGVAVSTTTQYQFRGIITRTVTGDTGSSVSDLLLTDLNTNYGVTLDSVLNVDYQCDGGIDVQKPFTTSYRLFSPDQSTSQIVISQYLSSLQPGNYCFYFTIDTSNKVAERLETNNQSNTYSFTVPIE